MVYYVTGDLFESPAQTLVNTVNTVGVMGKGIALRFKQIYPEMFLEYQELCERGKLTIGRLHVFRTGHKLVVNFPTKKHWRQASRPEYIRAGLETFVSSYEQMGVRSVAFPPLGCGNGELDFPDVVRPIMDHYLAELPIPVFIYAPHAQVHPPEHRVQESTRKWLRSQPRDLAFTEVWEDLQSLLRDQRRFETLAKGSGFEAMYDDERDVVRIEASGKPITVGRAEFYEIWTQLRELGYLTRNSVPASRSRDASYILPLLKELPYVRVVLSAPDYATFTANPSWGLQLVAAEQQNPAQRQLQLV